MSKHTPGPWKIHAATHRTHAGAKDDIMPPSWKPDSPMNRWPMPIAALWCATTDCEANRALIAAAPDLLAACKQMLKSEPPGTSLSIMLIAVIAKAEGK
jgi:hypothetical protein